MIIRALTLALLAVLPAVSSAAPTPEISFIYLAANTGGSAGGHSALRIGDRVFHYQAGSDMLLLVHRDPWSYFHKRYSLLDNRRMTLVRLDLDDDTRRELEEQLRLALGAKVDLRQTAKGKGKLTIHFGSHQEFDRLRTLLVSTTPVSTEVG